MILTQPAQIAAFRLASVRAQLKLEKIGLKSSGGALRPRLAKEFGLKPRDSHDTYIARVTELIHELQAQITQSEPVA